jgi:hypothetical protein
MASVIDKEHVEALRRSFELVGPIYPIVEDQNGREVAGRHRSLTGKDWPRQRRTFKNNFERELFILLSNTQRKPAEEEVKFRLNRVAMEYWIEYKCPEETVCAQLTKLLSPGYYTERWIQHLLDDRWKGPQGPKKTEVTSVSDVSANIGSKLETIKKIKTALQEQSNTLDSEPSYPYPECKCRECEHKTECGY